MQTQHNINTSMFWFQSDDDVHRQLSERHATRVMKIFKNTQGTWIAAFDLCFWGGAGGRAGEELSCLPIDRFFIHQEGIQRLDVIE